MRRVSAEPGDGMGERQGENQGRNESEREFPRFSGNQLNISSRENTKVALQKESRPFFNLY